MTDHSKNVLNARQIYFPSILGDLDTYENVHLYDEYLDTVLRKHVLDRLKIAAIESKHCHKKKCDRETLKMAERNCVLAELQKKEFQNFQNSLNEKDEWIKKKTEYIARYEALKSETTNGLAESSINDSHEAKMRRNIKKKTQNAEKLEELSRSLLLMVEDVNFLEDDEARNILLPDS